MPIWLRWIIAICAGMLGAGAFGFIATFFGASSLVGVLGAMLIMLAALMWASADK
jgi:hypothetical protein